MHKEFFIKIIICIIAIKFASAEVVDINNEQIIQLSNANIPIVDVRRSSEWAQTGVIPNSILLTFFDDEGNYDYNEWSKKLLSEIEDNQSIILICRSGNRSKIIANMMENKFDHTIYNAKYGILSWIKEELMTINPKKTE